MRYLSFINDISQTINKNDLHLLVEMFSEQFPETTFIVGNITDAQLPVLDVRFTQKQQCTPKHNIKRALVLVMFHSVDMMSIKIYFNIQRTWIIDSSKIQKNLSTDI